jgi:ketosteroid isomerase-like protein
MGLYRSRPLRHNAALVTTVTRVFVIAALLCLSGCARAANTEADTAAVQATLEKFYGAMKTADTATAMAQIADDALFVESGKLETRAEYEMNHLPNDIAFEKQITGKRSPWRVTIKGDTAWVIATTEYDGVVDGEDVNFVSAQLAVLTREEPGWRIRSIHWSSRRN